MGRVYTRVELEGLETPLSPILCKFTFMTYKQAINIICGQHRNLQRIKGLNKKTTSKEWQKRWFCKNHKKVHKYTFFSVITFCPGLERMYGVDTADEVKQLAYNLLIDEMNGRIKRQKLGIDKYGHTI